MQFGPLPIRKGAETLAGCRQGDFVLVDSDKRTLRPNQLGGFKRMPRPAECRVHERVLCF